MNKGQIVEQLENKVSRLEDELGYLGEYESKLKEELEDIHIYGQDKRSADQVTIDRLTKQLEKAQLVLANLIQIDRETDTESEST